MQSCKSFKTSFICFGIAIIILGLISLFFPSFLMSFLSILLGVLIILFAASQIYQGFAMKDLFGLSVAKIALYVVFILIGLLFIFQTNTPFILFQICFGLWALIYGIFRLSLAIRLQKIGETHIFIYIASILSILLGIIVMIFPVESTEIWVRIFGVYLLYLGIDTIIGASTAKYSNL